ncbi:hypothetical protein [Pseudomonas kurunegalensis]|uniref:phage tail tube protein n=1 Tax=Pseudomonas kurunegalensis TaxID=485880 RepID=UPI0035590451
MYKGYNAQDKTRAWVGSGGILGSFLDKDDKPVGGYFNFGHLSSLSIAISTEVIKFKDMTYGTLADARSKVISQSAEVTINMKNGSPEMSALQLNGNVFQDPAMTGQIEVVKAYKGRSIVLDGVIDEVTSITIEDSTVELVEGAEHDYIVSDSSIYFTDHSQIVDGDSLRVVYNKSAVSRIEALVKSGISLRLVFDGRNLGEDDSPVKVTLYKVALTPTTARQLLSSDWGDFEIKGTLELSKAAVRSGPGQSPLYKEEHVVPA